MKEVLAIILAGGRGKRMGFLCDDRPKPALPFAGRFRIIDFSLTNCVQSLVRDILVLTDYQRLQMERYIRRWCVENLGNSKAVHILEPKENAYRGTADAVFQNLSYVQSRYEDTVLILAGDHVYHMDYRKMLDFHEQAKADVTIGTLPVPVEEAHRFGIVSVDAKGRIIDFAEKPKMPLSSLASMGIYIVNKRVLSERLAEDAEKPDSPHDFGHAIIPGMIKRDRVLAYKFDGYWRDIGTLEAYYSANMDLLDPEPPFSLENGGAVLTGDGTQTAPAIGPRGTVKNSIVSRDCVIKGHVENSVLSPGVRVDEQAIVRNSVIMADTSIGYHSVVDHCILNEGVNVGKFSYLGFSANHGHPNLEDITVIGKSVTVPPCTAVGRNCRILPYVAANDFVDIIVTPGTTLKPRYPIDEEAATYKEKSSVGRP